MKAMVPGAIGESSPNNPITLLLTNTASGEAGDADVVDVVAVVVEVAVVDDDIAPSSKDNH